MKRITDEDLFNWFLYVRILFCCSCYCIFSQIFSFVCYFMLFRTTNRGQIELFSEKWKNEAECVGSDENKEHYQKVTRAIASEKQLELSYHVIM